MPTKQRLVDDAVFGSPNSDGWLTGAHTEYIELRPGARLEIQTSDGQTDDGTRGTWVITLRTESRTTMNQIPWMPLEKARNEALEWAFKMDERSGEWTLARFQPEKVDAEEKPADPADVEAPARDEARELGREVAEDADRSPDPVLDA